MGWETSLLFEKPVKNARTPRQKPCLPRFRAVLKNPIAEGDVCMRKIIVNTFITLDGVMQAPGGPEEDPTGGFEYGG